MMRRPPILPLFPHPTLFRPPRLHAPLRFSRPRLIYIVFGDSDFTARLAPALMGTLLVALPYLLRHQLGRIAALASGVILAVSPSILYYSRSEERRVGKECRSRWSPYH